VSEQLPEVLESSGIAEPVTEPQATSETVDDVETVDVMAISPASVVMPISVSVELEAAWFMVLMEAIVPFDADIAAAMDEMPVSVGDGAPLVV
jgi:hypothetical protein